MTDLEKLWDDLPTRKPPVTDILREARVEAARRRRRQRLVVRPLIGAAAAIALVGAFVAGGAVDGPGGTRSSDLRPAAFQADLSPAASCEDLLDSYRDRGLEQVTKDGWRKDGTIPLNLQLGDTAMGPMVPAAAGEFFRTTGEALHKAVGTGTNTQEVGVDEPDTLKTDGTRLVRMRGNYLVTYDTSGKEILKRSSLRLPDFRDGSLLLRGDEVVAVGTDARSGQLSGSRVIVVSLADDAEPRITSTTTYSSRIVSTRQHGDVVRLVMSSGLPDLDFQRSTSVDGAKVLTANRKVVRESTLEDWLPTVTQQGTKRQLLDCGDVALPPAGLGLDTTSIVSFDLTKPTKQHAIGLAGAAGIAYESDSHLYLAAPPTTYDGGVTHLFDFDLDGLRTTHVASGEVPGRVLDRWSLDEADDVLRVAVAPSQDTDFASAVVTFERRGEDLVERGRIDGLGRGEALKSVRWFDDLAVLVTFQVTDPLHTVDLSNTERPRLLGSLEVPGFSAYLHPLGKDRLLGVGYGGGGAQLSLFDLSDRSDVRERDTTSFRGWRPLVDGETRAFTWLPGKTTVLTVLQRRKDVAVAQVKVGDGTLTGGLSRLGDVNPDRVRTVGLADGRVAVVSGRLTRFLPLD